jgi:hypothetical protein
MLPPSRCHIMESEHRLPISIQLVGLTAVPALCFYAAWVFNLSRALLHSREALPSVDAGSLILSCIPLFLGITACALSLFTFGSLLLRTARNAALISIVYLVFLLILLVVQLVAIVLVQSELPQPQNLFVVSLGMKLLCSAWLVGLFIKVWPHYWRKRTAANKLQ